MEKIIGRKRRGDNNKERVEAIKKELRKASGDSSIDKVESKQVREIAPTKTSFPSIKSLQSVPLVDLGEDLADLDPVEKLAVWLDASGLAPEEIGPRLGRPPSFVPSLRLGNESYRTMLSRCHSLIAERMMERKFSIEDLFNEQVRKSAATLVEIRDNPLNRTQDRIKAAVEFLDRAPHAPRRRAEAEERQLVIQLPIGAMKGIRQVLEEAGTEEDSELLELLNSSDSNEIDGIKNNLLSPTSPSITIDIPQCDG